MTDTASPVAVPPMASAAARYVVASGVPAIVNFASIAVYTRLLSPADYGEYALVLACVAVSNAVGFQWLRSGARRYLPDRVVRRSVLLSLRSIYPVMFAMAAAVTVLLMVVAPGVRALSAFALLVLIGEAWFELNQEIAIADLHPWRYGAAALAKAVIGLGTGVVLIRAGFGAAGPVIGLATGFLVPAVLMSGWVIAPGADAPNRATLSLLARYGLPLTASFALQFILDSSDRGLLALYRGTAQVGSYAAAYDLTSQTITLLFMMVNLAAFPIALRALREHGAAHARQRLAEQGVLLVAIGMPAAVGLGMLSPGIAAVFLGSRFVASGTILIPVIAAGIFFAGFKAFYFDLAFQVGERTTGIVRVGAVAAVVNVVLNLWVIPRYGALGAATTTLVAFVIACGLSAWSGRAAFALLLPWRQWLQIALGCGAMAAILWPWRTTHSAPGLAGVMAIGGLTYGAVLLLFNVGGIRREVRRIAQG